jgi:threonine dehydrogenase-like Zn-dependent dehydrogenase
MNMREVPQPKLAPDEILIEVSYSGICGSELGGYLGHNSLRVPPLIMGHEFSGIVVERGAGVATLKPKLSDGDRVTVNPLIHDPWSKASLKGRQNLDRDRRIVGIHRPGSYAQFVAVPATNTYRLPDNMSLEVAALTEPVACAMRAAGLSGCRATGAALVTGLGPIGLLTSLILQGSGVHTIVASDTDPDRRSIGESYGLHVIDPKLHNVADVAKNLTGGHGVDVAIDAVGTHATRRECIEAVSWGGRVIFAGLHEEESMLQANYIIRSEITLQGSFAYTTADFEDALDWLADGRVRIDPWVHTAPLSQGGECFERLLSKPGPIVKILLES